MISIHKMAQCCVQLNSPGGFGFSLLGKVSDHSDRTSPVQKKVGKYKDSHKV